MASPRVLNPQVQVPVTRQQRVTRQPSFPHSILGRPWEIVPGGLIPVLPGETMTQAYYQAQFWTDPLKANMKNTPWTYEFFLFYAKFRDLPGWEASADGLGRDLIQMIESNEDQTPNLLVAANLATYENIGSLGLLANAMNRIIECYFREEGQAYNLALGPTPEFYPLANVYPGGRRDVFDRLNVAVGAVPAAEDRRIAMPGFMGGLIEQAWMNYAANANQSTAELQAMDYEDIVRSAGGRAVVRDVDRDQLHVPELLGMYKHTDYPVNTVEPTTGAPSVAFGHRCKHGFKQNFRFPEFGWIVPVHCWRPKAFMKNQLASFASMMSSRSDWFIASDDPDADAHWKVIADNTGPLKGIMDTPNNGYAIDLRSLMWGGEQFLNYDPATTNTGECFVALPTAAGGRDYVSTTDMDAVWATTGGRIRLNGILDVSIKTYPALNPNLTQQDRQFSNRD